MAAAEPPAATAGPDGIEIRLARPAEYAAAGDLVADVYAAEGFAHGAYVDVLRDAARRAAEADLLVAVDAGGRVVGTLTFAPGGTPWADVAGPDEAEFRMLAVLPAARGRGIAERLVRASIERARAGGHRRLVLSSQPEMRAAHRLYERLGFARTPERDWSPEPGMRRLRVFVLDLGPASFDAAKAGAPAAPPR
jgi:ribosomal protein S18 acetylase RimI-like enzyme